MTATSYEGYEIGCATGDDGSPLPWPLVKSRLDGKIKSIVHGAGADEYVVHMSGSSNFRKDVATIRPYKGNRSADKPHWHDKIEEYLKSGLNHPVYIAEGMEADDSMGIAQCESNKEQFSHGIHEDPTLCDTIICSRDKDMKMIPGWHYQWSTGGKEATGPWFVTEEEGMKWFFTQLLTGDPTDNIPGLYGIGPKHAERFLDGITEPLRMYSVVKEQYEKRFGSYWRQFMEENATLLWIMRQEPNPNSHLLHGYEAYSLLEDFQVNLEELEETLDV